MKIVGPSGRTHTSTYAELVAQILRKGSPISLRNPFESLGNLTTTKLNQKLLEFLEAYTFFTPSSAFNIGFAISIKLILPNASMGVLYD